MSSSKKFDPSHLPSTAATASLYNSLLYMKSTAATAAPGVWGVVHLDSEDVTAAWYLVAGHLATTAAYGFLFTVLWENLMAGYKMTSELHE